jgi:hypothetical protein
MSSDFAGSAGCHHRPRSFRIAIVFPLRANGTVLSIHGLIGLEGCYRLSGINEKPCFVAALRSSLSQQAKASCSPVANESSPARVHGVVGAERMGASALGSVRQECVGDGVTEDSTPDVLQILKGSIELGRRKAPAFAHPSQGRGGLDMSNGRGADAIRLGICAPGLLGSRLVDQELDQRAGIEVEAQRRPSETYAAALLPEPRSLAGLLGR